MSDQPHPAPEQGEAQCGGSGIVQRRGDFAQHSCPGCPDCKQGEAASEERQQLDNALDALVKIEAYARDRIGDERLVRMAQDGLFTEIKPAPPEAASVCPTCEAQRPDYCAHHGRNLSRHRHKGAGCCPDPFHDTPLPADQEPCECGEPDTRHVVHRSDGPCYQYEDAAEPASPEESAEERLLPALREAFDHEQKRRVEAEAALAAERKRAEDQIRRKREAQRLLEEARSAASSLKAALEEAADDLGKAANQFASMRESQRAGHTPTIERNPEIFAEKEARARSSLANSPTEAHE